MHIFIDESGNFAPAPGTAASVSVVGALVVPECRIERLFKKYLRLRPSLKKGHAEVKGRLLSEAEVGRVLDLLNKNSCLFEAVAIDMALETKAELEAHRAGQASYLTKDLTPDHHPELIAQVRSLRARLEAMPLQLYVQSAVMNQLIGNTIRLVPAYWMQRTPSEALTYHWVIDGKQVGRVTAAEDWWATTMLGLLQSKSHREPIISLDWVDYSAFDAKFSRPMPEWLRERMPGAEHAIDLKLMLQESFRFSSDAEPGLELVDIVTNATRRALMGNLARGGWAGLSKLMIHRPEQYLQFITLGRSERTGSRPYGHIIEAAFRSGGRSMLTRHALEEA